MQGTFNALSNGYLQLIDTLFYDGQNASEAYDSYNCLAMSPLFMDDLTTNITFKAKDIVGNTANQIVAAEIDFADGSGYLPYIADSIYSLSYSSSGGYVINLRIITTSADTMVARSAISVLKEEELSAKKGLLTGRGFSSDYDCEDCNEIPVRDEEYQIVRAGIDNDAMIKIWFGRDASGLKKTSFTKPFVIVDGFDPIPLKGIDRSAEEIFFETNYKDNYSDDCKDIAEEIHNPLPEIEIGLLDRLMDLGFDIAIVDFEWGGNDIMENVEALKESIGYINTKLAQNGSGEKLVVMGPSMGALISRIALSQMTNHNTKLYLSYDGPQQGAYISMPLQAFYGWAISDLNTALISMGVASVIMQKYGLAAAIAGIGLTFNGLENRYSPLECPAAKQMLMFHHSSSSNKQPFQPTQDHLTLYNSIAGQYPQNCLNVAISNGNGAGSSQPRFPGIGSDYLDFTHDIGDNLKLTIANFELPLDGSLAPFFTMKIIRQVWGTELTIWKKTYKSYVSGNSRSYESKPGGNFDATQLLFSMFDHSYDNYECFMPLSTSLDLGSSVSDHIYSEFDINPDFQFVVNEYSGKSPFDLLYVCDENTFHCLRGPNRPEIVAAIPGMNPDLLDFAVWIIDNADIVDGLDKQAAYLYYDAYHSGGIQSCSHLFNQNAIADGIVSTSYNAGDISMSDISISGSDKAIEIYSTGTITLGTNVYIGNGASAYIGPGTCIE
ncbi:MAG TPA: hypothetical protein VJ951_15920 [Bacteroidales bacterium]|nr:hypothetical protein [Bacteroidales bacterium]